MSELETSNKVTERGVMLLEKIVHARFSLLIITVILSVDTALSMTFGRNILTFEWRFDSEHISVGFAILFLAAYSVAMSWIFPFLKYPLDQLFFEIRCLSWVLRLFPFKEDPYSEQRDRYVRVATLRDKALERRDEFALKIVEDHIEKHQKKRDEEVAVATLAFSCAVLFCTNLAIGSYSITRYLAELSGHPLEVCIAGVLTLALPWFFDLCTEDFSARWVEYPPVAQELAKKRSITPAYLAGSVFHSQDRTTGSCELGD